MSDGDQYKEHVPQVIYNLFSPFLQNDSFRPWCSAGLIHDTIEYQGSENQSILGSFENWRIENNYYEMVVSGFLSIIL